MTALKANTAAKKTLSYVFLPGILPRLREVFGPGFSYLAFLIATIYNAVRILPAGHPFLNPSNIGQFGIRQVIAEAANHIVFSRNNIDQIIVFIAILAGIVILALQFLALLLAMFSSQAWAGAAGGPSFGGIFHTAYPENDIAFLLLDYVFGLEGFFGSSAVIPTGFHVALHGMFEFYNFAILVVSLVVFGYFVIVVVAETATTGTPFGKRFSSVYAPFRLVIAIGLLVPLSHGLNASQYITLYMAKIGSGFATTAWVNFNNNLDSTYSPIGVKSASLISKVDTPPLDNIVQFMMIIHSCRQAYALTTGADDYIKAYLNKAGSVPQELTSMDYDAASAFFDRGNITVTFGHLDGAGKLEPFCGVVEIPVQVSEESLIHVADGGAANIIATYYSEFQYLWDNRAGSYSLLTKLGERFAYANKPRVTRADYCYEETVIEDSTTCFTKKGEPPASKKQDAINFLQSIFDANVEIAYQQIRENLDLSISEEVLRFGWGGAGIAFNKIAQINGEFGAVVKTKPKIIALPVVMQKILKVRRERDNKIPECQAFDPTVSIPGGGYFSYYAKVLSSAYRYWCKDPSVSGAEKAFTSNVFWDAMNDLLGTTALFTIGQNDEGEYVVGGIRDPDLGPDVIHPLAQMSAVGYGLVSSAIENMGYAMTFSTFGGLLGAVSPAADSALQAASGFYVSIATVGLSAGFILYYILPFFPFMYFFFGVASWVKTIFEAMVGAPLWALAHLRIDGDGFSGKSAANGYFLIFEIFIRPILTIFGLLAGTAIFAALASIYHEIFQIVISNAAGYGEESIEASEVDVGGGDSVRRYIVDQFFFTIIYTINFYMMATAAFKMVFDIPNNILRWMGSNAAAFADDQDDPTQNLTQYASLGVNQFGGQIMGGLTQAGRAGGTFAGALPSALAAGRGGRDA